MQMQLPSTYEGCIVVNCNGKDNMRNLPEVLDMIINLKYLAAVYIA